MKYYIIRHDKSEINFKKKVALIAHVNYPSLIELCFSYIELVPEHVDIFITTKGQDNIKRIKERIKQMKRTNIKIVVPEDRGREISGLLIACKEYLKNYDYIGFVHDKKKNQGEPFQSVGRAFFDVLWENTLKNGFYINNVLTEFEKDPQLGLLAPPIPYTSHFFMVGFLGWTGCFDKSKELAQKLNLHCNMCEQIQPKILGTTFWCRYEALAPLFLHNWAYTDFEPEPMPIDNTISHAIERILPYVAESQGYKSGIIMTPEYAATYYSNYKYMFNQVTLAIDEIPNSDVDSLEDMYATRKRLSCFCNKHSGIYIYGAGKKAKECLEIIEDKKKIKGFIVSDGHKDKNETYLGLSITELSEINASDDIGIIIALRSEYMKQVYPELIKKGFHEVERFI